MTQRVRGMERGMMMRRNLAFQLFLGSIAMHVVLGPCSAGDGAQPSTSTVPEQASSASDSPANTNAHAILQRADQARGNLAGVIWQVSLVTSNQSKTTAVSYSVQAKGFDFVATTLAPQKQKGQKLILLKGNMWFWKQDLNKPVPISQRQKLTGNASYGDIAATNYADDYTEKPLEDELVNGEPCHVFDLTAKNKERTTYDRIVYWISKSRGVGIKADYYSVSGMRLKSSTMEYENVAKSDDGQQQVFISRMVIANQVTASEATTLDFSTPKLTDVPASVFNLNLLMK